ncbi:C3H1-type domain-containing protein [Meloidogyne graminicola]|uniref:C3H1-type domain-containing protein n=1 Tax=Meloidogyne graminicola TaxID=189291 RepID=A0A8S9ZVH5_9BILA|nr:C3H1-type domain-containing protein [Meloidogyne graminicola]
MYIRILPENQNNVQHCYEHPLLFNIKSNETINSFDSCYFSDHSILSRETKYAIRLGFNKKQLQIAINSLNKEGKKQIEEDEIILELIKNNKEFNNKNNNNLIKINNNNNKIILKLRSIVIDGSNIAMTHGNKTLFSCRGIRECVNYFIERGHTDILVFIPQFRKEQCRSDAPIIDQHILNELEKEKRLIWTPSRRIGGKRIVCHDDRYILKTAVEKQAVIVSNDEYRDLIKENPCWRFVVENYLLMYSFVDGKFMPPDDPLGRQGPNLDQLLILEGNNYLFNNKQICPYAKKCTYGNKCKYFHPERPNGVRIGAVDRLINLGNNNQLKKTLTARPSLVAEECVSSSSSSHLLSPGGGGHLNVGRTQSLNLTINNNNSEKQLLLYQNMYSPSSNIWGECEFSLSLSNLTINEKINNLKEENNLEKYRQHLKYHLSQIFPETSVNAVMDAHPKEIEAQILCQRIIAFQKGFFE